MAENEETTLVRAAIITGSTRGIGRAIAEKLAAAGMNVCINCSRESGLENAQAVAATIAEQYGVEAIAVAADVSVAEQAQKLVSEAIAAFGRIDVLVNNAGITRDGLLMRMKEADFDAVINVNLKGAFNMCQAVAKPMMKQRWGRIISMSSVVGVYGNAGQVNYAASKAGIIGITKSMAKELASRGITANAIAPGFIETDMTDAIPEKQRDELIANIGCGRMGKPEDVANLAAFLASDGAAYITGQTICIDGGLF